MRKGQGGGGGEKIWQPAGVGEKSRAQDLAKRQARAHGGIYARCDLQGRLKTPTAPTNRFVGAVPE